MLLNSLRARLIGACVVVMMITTALSLAGSTQLMKRVLSEQAMAQARDVVAVLERGLEAPLAQRDDITVQQLLDGVKHTQTIDYLVLFDHRERLIAASGWDPKQPLPPRDAGDIDLNRTDTTLHLEVPISMAGQQIARLALGLSTDRLRKARAEFIENSLLIASFALAVFVAFMGAISFALTHHLRTLARASEQIAAGQFDIRVNVESTDEVGRLAQSFNAMATAVQQRVTALQLSEQQQRLNLSLAHDEQARMSTLLGAIKSGILFVDRELRVIYANASFLRLWNLGELRPGTPLASLLARMLPQTQSEDAAVLSQMLAPVTDLQLLAEEEVRMSDGRLLTQRVQRVDHSAEAGGGYIWLHRDITLTRQTQQRAQLALRDPLTDLLNRRGLFDTLQAAIKARATSGEADMALMFIDLDDFKYANDVGGHGLGDRILIAVGRAIAGQLRSGETVARLGGDEFAVLSPDAASPEQAGAIARRLVDAISGLAFESGAQTLRVGASIGVALYPSQAGTADELIARADTAMYEAKRNGKNTWALYEEDQARRNSESARMGWNERIRTALREGHLRLHFQPVRRAGDLGIDYHEALVRMVDEHDPTRLIPPNQFIPHAERSGKIRLIDRWVFEACCDKLATSPASLSLAANLSARSLEDPEFLPFLQDALQCRDVDPRRLHIELTETAANADLGTARSLIRALRGMGCAVHLDDFGSGLSSFSMLKMLDVDAIKIDGAFIRDLAHDTSQQLVVEALIKVARSQHKITVAECVEDAATLDVLRRLGVDRVQGFHLGRPTEQIAAANARERLWLVSDFGGSGFGGASL